MTDRGHPGDRIADPPGTAASPRVALGKSRPIVAACWLYAGAVASAWAVGRWSPAEFWPAHLLLYGPRWALAMPMVPLVLWAARRRSWWSAPAIGVAAVAFLPFWGFVPPGLGTVEALGPDPARPTLRLLTCNVQLGDLRVAALAALIREARPDLVLLQECRLADPRAALGPGSWHVRSEGEFCLASRTPIVGFSVLRRPDKAYRAIAARADVSWSGRTVAVVSAHLMTPRRGLEAILRSPTGGLGAIRDVARIQRYESGLLRRWADDAPGPLLVAGDFNLTAEHPLYRRDWSGFADAFSGASWGLGETMFTRRIGLRIDHILAGPGWRAGRCWVGPNVGSAHRPVLADLSWVGPFADPSGR